MFLLSYSRLKKILMELKENRETVFKTERN